MPRRPRELSPSNIYHVVVRGNNKSDLFLSDADKYMFMSILKKIKKDGEYELYAYCLMRNHVHLLLAAEDTYLQRTMRRILQLYAKYFNKSYGRSGHVFQDRFRSQAIDTQYYFMACARYIHNNPVKAGIVKTPEIYPWSSYREYIAMQEKGLTDKDRLYGCFSPENLKAAEMFHQFTRINTDEVFLDYVDDTTILKTIQDILSRHGINNPEELKIIKKEIRNTVILQFIKGN